MPYGDARTPYARRPAPLRPNNGGVAGGVTRPRSPGATTTDAADARVSVARRGDLSRGDAVVTGADMWDTSAAADQEHVSDSEKRFFTTNALFRALLSVSRRVVDSTQCGCRDSANAPTYRATYLTRVRLCGGL